MNNNNIKLVVNKIIGESINGYSRVTLGYELFNAIKGANPSLEYTRESNGVRKFVINGIVIYSHFTVDASKKASTTFIMRTSDAIANQITEASTLPFALASFTSPVLA